MPPDIVIRPSGVWDSRAPFHDYLLRHRYLLRTYNVLTLAIYRLRYEVRDPEVAKRSGRKWIRAENAGVQAGRSWGNYRRNLPRLSRDILPAPTSSQVAEDLKNALDDIRQYTIVSCSSMFETYVQCWSLNVLLTALESGAVWTSAQRRLAASFSPEHGGESLPSVPRIIETFPPLHEGLAALPTIETTQSGDEETEVVATSSYNAVEAVRFWRAVRNLIVHRGGVLNESFLRRHGAFYGRLAAYYTYLPQLERGQGFRFYDDIVRAMVGVHYRVAKWMSDYLESVANETRGHPYAPNPRPPEVFFSGTPPPSPELLLQGDHSPSFRWTIDPAFRTEFRASAAP